MPVGIIARLQIKPEQANIFEHTFLHFQEQVRSNEPGCVYFHLHKSRVYPVEYVVMEQYSSQAAYETHQETEYYKSIPQTFGDFMAGPPTIEVFDTV